MNFFLKTPLNFPILGQVAACLIAVFSYSGAAWAQYPGNAPPGAGPKEDDVLETDDIVDDQFSLPPDEFLEDDEETKETVREIERQNAAELAYSANEKRSRYSYVAGFMIGFGRPWQVYSIDIGYLRNERQAFGMYAGGGTISSTGITKEKAYEMRVTSRGSGFFYRHWLENPDILSFDVSLGYTSWEGTVTPQGSDTSETDETGNDVLTSSFRGNGVSTGLAVNATWVWENGFHIEWIPILVHYSRFLQKDISRETDINKDTINRNLINLVGADRVLLGSDYCFDMGLEEPVQTVERLTDIATTERDLILGKTAARLLRME